MATIWNVLGLEPTTDCRDIKRAYARLLKLTRPEEDPQGFQVLRRAYETALSQCCDPDPRITRSAVSEGTKEVVVSGVPVDENRAVATGAETRGNYSGALSEAESGRDLRLLSRSLVDEVINKIRSKGPVAAAKHLEDLVSSDLLLSFHVRQYFEGDLLYALSQEEGISLHVLAKGNELFGWEDRRHPLRQYFGQVMEASAQARIALAARDVLEELAVDAKHRAAFSREWRQRGLASRLLLSEWNSARFTRQIYKPGMIDALKDLHDYVRSNFGLSYRLILDPRIVNFWEEKVRVPRVGGWVIAFLYVAFIFPVFSALRWFGIQIFPGFERLDGVDGAVSVVALLVDIVLTAAAYVSVHWVVQNWAKHIVLFVNRIGEWNRYLRYDQRSRAVGIAFTILLIPVALMSGERWGLAFVGAGYLFIVYWTRQLTLLLPFGLVAAIYQIPVAVVIKGVASGETATPNIHLISLGIVFGQWLTLRWLCQLRRWSISNREFLIASGLMAVMLVGVVVNDYDRVGSHPEFRPPRSAKIESQTARDEELKRLERAVETVINDTSAKQGERPSGRVDGYPKLFSFEWEHEKSMGCAEGADCNPKPSYRLQSR